MNQQEIFQNMTKPFPWEKSSMLGVYDVRAANSAVNNTYGKGINPEGVEKMKEALGLIEDEAGLEFPDLGFILKTAKEALNAAKIIKP